MSTVEANDTAPREMTVRIAVCVDGRGAWAASGWGYDGKSFPKETMDTAVDGVGDGEARFWVEVTLPMPSVPVLKAVAEPAQ